MVKRAGVVATIPTEALVPGDVVLLSAGASVPADVRVVEASSLKVDNSMLTGESEPVTLNTAPYPADAAASQLEATNVAFMGTSVTEGAGTAVVIATGNGVQMAQSAKSISKTT